MDTVEVLVDGVDLFWSDFVRCGEKQGGGLEWNRFRRWHSGCGGCDGCDASCCVEVVAAGWRERWIAGMRRLPTTITKDGRVI